MNKNKKYYFEESQNAKRIDDAFSIGDDDDIVTEDSSETEDFKSDTEDSSKTEDYENCTVAKRFTSFQQNEMAKIFKKRNYISTDEKHNLAKRLDLTVDQVRRWFAKRRFNSKKKEDLSKIKIVDDKGIKKMKKAISCAMNSSQNEVLINHLKVILDSFVKVIEPILSHVTNISKNK